MHVTSGYMFGGEIGKRGGLADWFHSATFPFRLPLFSLLVGYFSPINPTTRNFQSLIRHVVLPFTVISALHVALTYSQTGKIEFDPAASQYTLWFMFAVIIWRASAPYLWQLKHLLLISVLISLLAGQYYSLWVFGLYSTTGMLPFFVLGMKLRYERNYLSERTRLRTGIAVAIVVAWFIGVTLLFDNALLDRAVIGMTESYKAVDPQGAWAAMGWRLVVLITVGATMLAGLYLTPRGRIPIISYVGAGGFTIYLLHGLVLRIARINGLMPTPDEYTTWTVPLLIAASFLLALILGSKPVRWLAGPLVRPRAKWLFKRTDELADAAT